MNFMKTTIKFDGSYHTVERASCFPRICTIDDALQSVSHSMAIVEEGIDFKGLTSLGALVIFQEAKPFQWKPAS